MTEQAAKAVGRDGKEDLLVIKDLVKYYPIRGGLLQRIQAWVKAVDGVSFTIKRGETLGLVGESGCGKTTVGRTLLGLIPHNAGSVYFEGQDVLAAFASEKERNIQQMARRSAMTAAPFLLSALNLMPIYVVAMLLTLVYLVGLGWKGLVARQRQEAMQEFVRQNAIPWIVGLVGGAIWFNLLVAIFGGMGTLLGKVLIPVGLLLVIVFGVQSYFGRIIGARTKKLRRNMQIVFQDPFSSLDPRMPVGESIGEGLLVHGDRDPKKRWQTVLQTMDLVGLREFHARRYPHEFSGGQRQRIGIARALALQPKFIVCDEPVSALDVSVQAQVLNILMDLQEELGLTYLFIAHNLSVVEHISNRVAVMYVGKLVELTSREELFTNPLHPYTQALMSAIPVPDPNLKRERIILEGDVPSPVNPPSGCRFHPRCPVVMDRCSQEAPEFKDVGDGHYVACWRVE